MALIARALGPLEAIVNVGWGSGYYAAVTGIAFYDQRPIGTASASLLLSTIGRAAGGVILGEKLFAIPAGPGHGLLPSTRYVGVMQFRSIPTKLTSAFSLRLTGSIIKEDIVNPGVSIQPFCGVTSIFVAYGPYVLVNVGGGQRIVQQSVSFTTSDPSGTTSGGYIQNVADVTIPDGIGQGSHTFESSSSEIWYVDSNGNYVNTHQPCSELPAPGGPPATATRVEGFNNVRVEIFRKLPTSDPLPVIDWAADNSTAEILNGSDDAIFRTIIPLRTVGLNSDHQPIFDDLPDDSYDFRVQRLLFTQLATPPSPNYSVIGVYPLAPTFARYQFAVGTIKPTQVLHLTIPNNLLIDPGAQPPTNATFEV